MYPQSKPTGIRVTSRDGTVWNYDDGRTYEFSGDLAIFDGAGTMIATFNEAYWTAVEVGAKERLIA